MTDKDQHRLPPIPENRQRGRIVGDDGVVLLLGEFKIDGVSGTFYPADTAPLELTAPTASIVTEAGNGWPIRNVHPCDAERGHYHFDLGPNR
jgi:hypothetical protein